MSDNRVRMAAVLFESLLDSRLELARHVMKTAFSETQRTAPEGSGEAIKLACSEYFAKQERLFLAEINKVFPDGK